LPADCAVRAYNPANGVYIQSATSSVVTFSFLARSQTTVSITNSTTSTNTSHFTLTASGGLGTIAYVFQTASSGCSISNATLNFTGLTVPTSCVVTAFNPANGLFGRSDNSAPVTFVFNAEPQSTVTITNTVTSTDLSSFALSASGGSGIIDYAFATTSTGCAITGTTQNLTSLTLPITCSVVATNPANGIYARSDDSGAVLFNFVVGPVSPSASTITINKSEVVDDGMDSAVLTVTLRDGRGFPIAGKNVSLDQGVSLSTVNAASYVSDANGQVRFTLTDTHDEMVTYVATDVTDGATGLSGSVTVVFTTAAPALGIASAVISGVASINQVLSATAVGVTGEPTPTETYQWFRDGIAIP
jgi:Bacterial Ig-like domain (group 1)